MSNFSYFFCDVLFGKKKLESSRIPEPFTFPSTPFVPGSPGGPREIVFDDTDFLDVFCGTITEPNPGFPP